MPKTPTRSRTPPRLGSPTQTRGGTPGLRGVALPSVQDGVANAEEVDLSVAMASSVTQLLAGGPGERAQAYALLDATRVEVNVAAACVPHLCRLMGEDHQAVRADEYRTVGRHLATLGRRRQLSRWPRAIPSSSSPRHIDLLTYVNESMIAKM